MLTVSCHCRRVLIEVAAPPSYLNQCNCSICRRYGTLWGYYRPDQVRLLGEPDATETYMWSERSLAFHRCRVCGCVTHWQATDPDYARMGINARLLDPADIAEVPVRISPGPP